MTYRSSTLVLEGPRQAHAVVVIIKVAGARAFDLSRIAAKMERRCRKRHVFREGRRVIALVDEHLVPVDLEITHVPDTMHAGRNFSREIGDDCPLEAGREAYFAGDRLPASVGHLRLDIR